MTPLSNLIDGIGTSFGPLCTKTIEDCQRWIQRLACTLDTEHWLKGLEPNPTTVLHQDPVQGFVLKTHHVLEGQYFAPHDHGQGWVIYAVQSGEMELSTYVEPGGKGTAPLVRRERYRMGPGDCRVFLPGDIHDTRCVSKSVRLFRFTSCDLDIEAEEGRMTKFVARDGDWVRPSSV
ncbi:MAG: hypothetical protein AAGA48_04265 [Myxococcota bacterium]